MLSLTKLLKMLTALGFRRFLNNVTEATIPAADTVPDGYEVWHTELKVKLRSNGTDWLALSEFDIYYAEPLDQITVTTSQATLRVVSIGHALKYIGATRGGQIRVQVRTARTNSANAQTHAVRFSDTAVDLSGVSLFNGASTSIPGVFIDKNIMSRTNTSQFFVGSTAAGNNTTGAAGITPSSVDYTAGNGFIHVTAFGNSAAAAANETATLVMIKITACPR